MKKTLLIALFSALNNISYAQWTTSGNDISNTNTGNVGIGTSSPTNKLDVVGGINTSETSTINGLTFSLYNTYWRQLKANGYNLDIVSGNGASQLSIPYSDASPARFQNFGLIIDKNVGIGTTDLTAKLTVAATTGVASPGSSALAIVDGGNTSYGFDFALEGLYTGDLTLRRINAGIAASTMTFRRANGNVGIGTTIPDEKLTVAGNIHAQEVKIELSVPGPDYVFKKDYVLLPLKEVQAYISQNQHLPEIASATEMKDKGVQLGEMNMKLLKKIEELTLYLIEQNKRIEQLEKQIR